jgi:phosphohistidine phosphatase
MNLFILRHGIAMEREDWDKDDALRPLTHDGEKQLAGVARAMKKMGLEFDLILSSPYERAKKTAEIIAEKLKLEKQLKFANELSCEGNAEKLINQIAGLKPEPENALLAGHEPYLSELISTLVFGDAHAQIDFKKAGLCKLKTEKLRYGQCARLCWLLTPKQMELMD